MEKTFKSLEEQIEIMKNKGLVINDESFCKEVLLRENYFFLNGYRRAFMKNKDKSRFINGTTFEELYSLFLFDRSFRNILSEPAARNTAACIGYAAMEILKKYGDGVMIITPADHYIQDVSALTDIFKTAILTAEEQDKLVTIGLKPTFPSTGFGYIKYNAGLFISSGYRNNRY